MSSPLQQRWPWTAALGAVVVACLALAPAPSVVTPRRDDGVGAPIPAAPPPGPAPARAASAPAAASRSIRPAIPTRAMPAPRAARGTGAEDAVVAAVEADLGRELSGAERRDLVHALRALWRSAKVAEAASVGAGERGGQEAARARRAAGASRRIAEVDRRLAQRLGLGLAAVARALDREAIEEVEAAPVELPRDAARAWLAELVAAGSERR